MGTSESATNGSSAQPVVPRDSHSGRHAGVACRVVETLLRVMALPLSLAGALVLAKVEEDHVVSVASFPVTVRARHSYVKAYVFLVYANGIVAAYCLISLLLSFVSRSRLVAALLFLADLVLSYVLLAAAAASTEASYIAKRGESQVGWGEVCSNIKHFCAVVGVSIAFSYVATLVLVALVILSARRLFGRRYGGGPLPLSGTRA